MEQKEISEKRRLKYRNEFGMPDESDLVDYVTQHGVVIRRDGGMKRLIPWHKVESLDYHLRDMSIASALV